MGIIEKIAAAGIVGCGGAGFPTHKKLTGNIEHLIINGAECEPLLRTDRYLMKNKAPELICALLELKRELDIPRCTIALKGHYEEEVKALRCAIEEAGADIAIHEMEQFYPAGDEQVVVREVTGRTVPPAALPSAVGAVVNNISTIYAISQAMEGRNFTHRYLTVTGEVREPCVIYVPIGTSYRECIRLAGGAAGGAYFLVSGGPMMGKAMTMEEGETAVVTKTTSGILVLPPDGYHARSSRVDLRKMVSQAASVCMQCSSCTQLCPRHMLGHPLQPHLIMRRMAAGGDLSEMLEDQVIVSAQLCCECGICELYACPMGLYPRKINSAIKRELADRGLRGTWDQSAVYEADPNRGDRKVPTERLAGRAGVREYFHRQMGPVREAEPERVEIPVKMHIGVPARPVVEAGDRVRCGDVIARPPEGALGAMIHASISGRVESVGERIVIVKE